MPLWNKASGASGPLGQEQPAGNGVLETGLRFEMVDFFAEADKMIRLRLARQKSDVSWKRFYRIAGAGRAAAPGRFASGQVEQPPSSVTMCVPDPQAEEGSCRQFIA